MIADLKPYAAYKDSGLAWLGAVPGHWDVLPNRAIFFEVQDRNHSAEQMLSVTISRGIVKQSDLLLNNSKKDSSNLDKSAYKLIQKRDIAYNKMRAWQGAIGASNLRGIISPAYVVMRLRNDKNESEYFHHLFRTPGFAKEAERWSYGITSDMWSLRPEHFRLIYSLRPPLLEQAAITRFLNSTSSRIEMTIRAKRKVIALLNEQKRIIILQAVTQGMDPAVLLKPTGLPWLPAIPTHWEIRRFRTLVRGIDQGVSPQTVGFLAEGDSWGVLKSGCVNRGVFRETEHKQLASNFTIDPAIAVAIGDVLISRACGSPSLVGSVGRVKSLRYRLILSDKTFRAVFNAAVDTDFMVLAMNSRYYRAQVEQAISGAEGMANNLPLSSLKDFRFAIPPKAEALAIARSVGEATAGIDTRMARLEREIDLLREYRTRLIADVVTGKLDVREAALHLPDATAPDAEATVDDLDSDDELDDAELTEETTKA